MLKKLPEKKLPCRTGILLDVGCKNRKQPNWLGIDSKECPGVDIVHDLTKFPYPLESESCLTIKAAHFVEHLSPDKFFPFMDEMWRLLKPNGQIAISVPYAGSAAFWQDPTHSCGLTERSWQYLDPEYPMYEQYKPKPWSIDPGFPVWQTTGNLETILRKRTDPDMSAVLAQRAISLGAMQKLSELARLIHLLRNYKLSTVLEIGTAKGGLFYLLCQLAQDDAIIFSIDLPGGQFGGGYSLDEEKRFRSYGKVNQKLYFFRADSHLPDVKHSVVRALKKRKLDLLLIDGDHTYKGVKKDFEMYSPLVKSGGLIVFHDICFHPRVPECQVEKFWNEVKKGHRTLEYIDENDKSWGGIGVILWQ